MRKYLLMGAALGLLATAPLALAQDGNWGWGNNGDGGSTMPTLDAFLSFAAANNWAGSGYNSAYNGNGQSASSGIEFSGRSSTGVINQNANAGANSALQNALSLAYVVNPNQSYQNYGFGLTVAMASNRSFVKSNEDTFSYCNCPPSEVASIDSSYSGTTGEVQVNNNVGDNSVLQNASAIANVNYVSNYNGVLGASFATASNNGKVKNNDNDNYGATQSASTTNSYVGSSGVLNLNQNAGGNSLLQNSTSIGRVTLDPTSATTLAGTAALTDNDGAVFCNDSDSMAGQSTTYMDNSLNSSTGIMQASQNAGANSLMQNSVSVASVTP